MWIYWQSHEPDSWPAVFVKTVVCSGGSEKPVLGTVSRTSRELFGPEKLVVKLQPARFEKLIFLHAFNIRKIKRIAKFEGLELRRCEDKKGIVVPNIGPKSFGTFEKQVPGRCYLRISVYFLSNVCHVRWAIPHTRNDDSIVFFCFFFNKQCFHDEIHWSFFSSAITVFMIFLWENHIFQSIIDTPCF